MHANDDLTEDRLPAAAKPETGSISVTGNIPRERFGPGRPRASFLQESVFPHARFVRQFFEIVDDGDTDALLLANQSQMTSFDRIRYGDGCSFVPVINVSGQPSYLADADLVFDDPRSWEEVTAVIRRFRERRALLPASFRNAATSALRMLAHVFVSGGDLTPVRVPRSRYFFAYRGFQDTRSTTALAEALASAGMLKRRFVDRHPACSKCQSHRMLVREECPGCRSPELSRAAFIHHFSCASIEPEAAFRKGGALICPKCRKQLRHYGKDYDKPGDAQVCNKCGSHTSEPAVGFQCQDCGNHIDGDLVETADVFAYSLSEYVLARLNSRPGVSRAVHSTTFDDLPPALRNHVLEFGRGARGFVARLDYKARHCIVRDKGNASFQAFRRLFADQLQGLLADVACVDSSSGEDFVFVHSMSRKSFDANSSTVLAECDAVLPESLIPAFQIVWTSDEESFGD